MKRSAGVLLPVTSLPSKYGIGCFDKAAYDFVDWLVEADQTYWQMLPLMPTSYGDSPYQCFSTYAGNPYFISLDELIKEGVLTQQEVDEAKLGDKADDIDYAAIYYNRFPLLRKAYSRSNIEENAAYKTFVEKNSWWLEDYAFYMAVKKRHYDKSWLTWPENIRLREPDAMAYYRHYCSFEIGFHKYLQFKFDQQWKQLKKYANEKGIKLIGDVPIYVALDSADVWANPDLFQLDEKCNPTFVAGCPPDYFAPKGQLWGNPLYQWAKHEADDFVWWRGRIKYALDLYDIVRIDHFRGFDEYYSIPGDAEDAVIGSWKKGPGIKLFRSLEKHLGRLSVIAEDLGFMTDTVRQMLKDSGYPGMKVLQFAFDPNDINGGSDYLPHNIGANYVVYTGTHDNATLRGWLEEQDPKTITAIRRYLMNDTTPLAKLYPAIIALAMRCNAETCIIPIQDYLSLDNSARINVPSTIGTNWRWRLLEGQLTKKLAAEVKQLTMTFGRRSIL